MARDHPMLVQHSQYHTQGWRANGDISLILSKSPPEHPSVDEIIATEKYITGYACKGNETTGAVIDLFKDIVDSADEGSGATTKSVCSKLLMNTVKRDISTMEASYELLSLPLYRCSHELLSVSFTGSRVLERNGHTLTKSTPLDKYLSRPDDQPCSWYQFICKQGKVPVISGKNMYASWPLNEDYCRSMLLLHWPTWRKLSDIQDEDMSWTSAFDIFIITDTCPCFVKADVDRAKRKQSAHKEDEHQISEDEEDHENKPPWMQLLQPKPNFNTDPDIMFDDGGPERDWGHHSRNYPAGFGLKWLGQLDRDMSHGKPLTGQVTLAQLNGEQQFPFNIVLNTMLQHQKDPSSVHPLRLIITGTAGSGKSFLIKSLVSALTQVFENDKVVQVICPTGNSANLISGRTIHDFFRLPVRKKAHKEMTPPNGPVCQMLQQNCSDLKTLIVDERSLVGATTLGWMEYHCRFGMNVPTESWGGLPVVIFLGDDVQLPPVCDSPVYVTKCSTPAAIHGVLVWKAFNHVVELKSIVRQNKDQERLKEVLLSLREYRSDQNDVGWLQQFQWDNLRTSYGQHLLDDMTENGLFVFPTHDAESTHNNSQLLKANIEAPVAKVIAVNNGPHAKRAESDQAGGLLNILHLCVGAKVMLTSNLLVSYGLFNGSKEDKSHSDLVGEPQFTGVRA